MGAARPHLSRGAHRIRLPHFHTGVPRPELLLVDAGMRVPAQVFVCCAAARIGRLAAATRAAEVFSKNDLRLTPSLLIPPFLFIPLSCSVMLLPPFVPIHPNENV